MGSAPDAPHHTMQVDTYSEEYRHQCEVRYVLRRRVRSKEDAYDFLENIKKKRGLNAYNRLKNDCADQWAKGNRGAYGDWR